MKNLFAIITIGCMATSCSLAQLSTHPTKPWNASVKIIDEIGQPVSGATVQIHYVTPPYAFTDNPKYNGQFSGQTDTNGLYFATHDDRSDRLGFCVKKAGYYTTVSSYRLGDPQQYPQRRDISLTLTLKKIGQPTAMYAKQLVNLQVPENDKPVGYDLMIGDWVGPYGKGVNTDIILRKNYYENSANDYYSKITVGFPKAGDGIQVYEASDLEKGSELRSPHEAPTNGYIAELTREVKAYPGQKTKVEYDPNRIYFFRVRTKLDDKGNVVSARYGKIYGDFMTFSYYLNPTPNDRNIEFDPSKNLIHSLKFDEGVSAP